MATCQELFLALLYSLFLISAVKSSPYQSETEHASTFDDTVVDYRLPNIYTPSSYNLTLNVPEVVAGTSTYSGTVSIKFTVTANTNFTVLHVSHEFLMIKSVVLNNINLDESDYSIDNTTDKLTIDFTAGGGLSIRRVYTLVIAFDGVLSDKDMYGFYKSSYVDNDNKTRYLATTQFEAVYARRAFPCFDEPHLKATFDVTVTYSSTMSILFNTPAVTTTTDDSMSTTVFQQTPKISTYLIAFIISDFTCTSGENIEDTNVPYQVCSTSATENDRQWAVEIGPKLLRALNSYTNYNYSVNMKKMDQVAIPDFAAGAMENWGLVTYRENALLWRTDESSNSAKQSAATVIAHEFTHQWFGNLVTLKWWSVTYLNEGFARYFEYFITHQVLESWELNKQFVTAQLQTAMAADALENVQALESSCSSPAEISAKFGTISYSKGGSILRMVAHIMGEEKFKAGLQSYLSGKKLDNVETDDLWNALQNSVDNTVSKLPTGTTLKTVMENWIKLSGFPVLTVSLDGSEVSISQERFLLTGENKTSKWYVPISYSESSGGKTFESTSPDAWLSNTDDVLKITLPAGSEWIILNNQQTGYYRVNYDNELWTKIANALKAKNFSNIHELNRAQIVDDLFNLAKTDKIKYTKAFEVLEFLRNDTSYYSWVPALSGFGFLGQRLGLTSEVGKAMTAHILNLTENVYNSVPLTKIDDSNHIYTLKQSQIASWACQLGEKTCISNSTEMFTKYRTASTKVNANLRSVVYCTALRQSSDSGDWDFLWNKYKETDLASEKLTILAALGCTKNQDKLKEYLGFTLSEDSAIRSQNALQAFAAVYNGNPENVDIALEFLIQNYQSISERYNSMNALGSLITGIASKLSTDTQVQKLQSFINSATGLSGEEQEAVNVAVKTAEENIAWNKKYKDQIAEYYGISTGGAATTKMSALSFLTIILTYVFVKLF